MIAHLVERSLCCKLAKSENDTVTTSAAGGDKMSQPEITRCITESEASDCREGLRGPTGRPAQAIHGAVSSLGMGGRGQIKGLAERGLHQLLETFLFERPIQLRTRL